MAKLIYATPASLDGYLGENGDYDWSAPDDEAMEIINDILRPIGTHLYGRKLYETMAVWETPDVIPGITPAGMDFARIWQAVNKIVYSKSLDVVSTPNTRLEREFHQQAIRDLKAKSTRDLLVGGPTLAAQAIRYGLVDEYQLFVAPVIRGGGNPVLPRDVRVQLELVDERRSGNGTVFLSYRPRA